MKSRFKPSVEKSKETIKQRKTKKIKKPDGELNPSREKGGLRDSPSKIAKETIIKQNGFFFKVILYENNEEIKQ